MITPVALSPEDIARVAGDLLDGTADPESERQAISRAVQEFERIVGARMPAWSMCAIITAIWVV